MAIVVVHWFFLFLFKIILSDNCPRPMFCILSIRVVCAIVELNVLTHKSFENKTRKNVIRDNEKFEDSHVQHKKNLLVLSSSLVRYSLRSFRKHVFRHTRPSPLTKPIKRGGVADGRISFKKKKNI